MEVSANASLTLNFNFTTVAGNHFTYHKKTDTRSFNERK